ncbi:MAG: DNA cytosine methyltransferase [Candidatus Atribacteria bacterium]|nr:DNA cytosine methyltransferase [Candidatus Atribacteria bacterium]
MSNALYNENDPFAAAWLRELTKDGQIVPGIVDERSICDIRPEELDPYRQCHFFAGIGGWSYALRLARWPDDRPVWTGSCPCQPFSAAGKRKGTDDARHLWPAFRWLIAQCRPATIFGEQVASRLGREWLAGVRSDLEALGYVVRAADLCAAGVGAPHIRQRLFWVADAECTQRRAATPGRGHEQHWHVARREEASGRVQRGGEHGQRAQDDMAGGLPDPSGAGLAGRPEQPTRQERPALERSGDECFWRDSRLIACRDGKLRRIPLEPALFPLAARIPGRVGILRGAGNSIVPQVAAAFIQAAASKGK